MSIISLCNLAHTWGVCSQLTVITPGEHLVLKRAHNCLLSFVSRGCTGSTWGQKASAKRWSTRRSICCYCWAASRSVRKPRCRSSLGWAAGRRCPASSPSASAAGGWCASALLSESLSPSLGRQLEPCVGWLVFASAIQDFVSANVMPTTDVWVYSFFFNNLWISCSRMRFLVKRWHKATGMSSTAPCSISKNGAGLALGKQNIYHVFIWLLHVGGCHLEVMLNKS